VKGRCVKIWGLFITKKIKELLINELTD